MTNRLRARALGHLVWLGALLVPIACGDSEDHDGQQTKGGSSGSAGTGGSSSGAGGTPNAGRSNQGGSAGGGGASAGRGGVGGSGEAGSPPGGNGGDAGAGEGGAGGDAAGAGGEPGGASGNGGMSGSGGGAGGGMAGNAGSGGSGGSGGMAGNAGSAGSGGGIAGNGGNGGNAGNAGSGGSAGGAVCDDATPRVLAGSIDGETVTMTALGGGRSSRTSPAAFWDSRARLEADGFVHAWGDELLTATLVPALGRGHVVMPSGPLAGVHYCASSAVATIVDTFRHTLTLGGLTELGTCGVPNANDQIVGCYAAAAGSPVVCTPTEARLTGSLAGMALDATYVPNASNAMGTATPVATRFMAFGRGGLIALIGNATLSTGFIQMPEDGPRPGAIYCVGNASLIVDGSEYGFTLTELGYVGTCPAASSIPGSLDGCL